MRTPRGREGAPETLRETLVGVAGEPGVALACQQNAVDAVQTAQAKAAAITEEAQREATAVIAAAEQGAASAATSYATA